MVISHDRQFLNAVCNKIVDVENNRLYEYEGSFGDCIQKKQMAIKSLQRELPTKPSCWRLNPRRSRIESS